MKILVLSDLHFSLNEISFQILNLKRKFNQEEIKNADLIVITGDIFESNILKSEVNPFQILQNLFNDKPVVFCLGNHEFAYKDFNDVMNYWSKFKSSRVFCLDACGHAEFGNYNFVGNVFWYDFSLNHCRNLMKGEIIPGWLDSTIQNFDPIKENKKCQQQILNNISTTKKNILVTHMCPHINLNWFSQNDEFSPFNAYSGNADFLKKIKDKNFEYAFCGHTHKRMTDTIYGINCLNLGNDYFFRTHKIESFMVYLD